MQTPMNLPEFHTLKSRTVKNIDTWKWAYFWCRQMLTSEMGIVASN